MNIILVDDDKIIRRGLRKILERYGDKYTVIDEANNGKDAFDKIKEKKPDVVITDVKMPIMNGIELIKKIKGEHILCKTIVLSGFDEYNFVRESLKNGACDYLLKPIKNNELIELIDSMAEQIKKEKKDKLFEDEKKKADSMEAIFSVLNCNKDDYNDQYLEYTLFLMHVPYFGAKFESGKLLNKLKKKVQ